LNFSISKFALLSWKIALELWFLVGFLDNLSSNWYPPVFEYACWYNRKTGNCELCRHFDFKNRISLSNTISTISSTDCTLEILKSFLITYAMRIWMMGDASSNGSYFNDFFMTVPSKTIVAFTFSSVAWTRSLEMRLSITLSWHWQIETSLIFSVIYLSGF